MKIDQRLSGYFRHSARVLGPYRMQASQLASVPDDVAAACRTSPYLRSKASCEDQLIALAAARMGVSLLPTEVTYQPLDDHAASIRRVANRWIVTVDPDFIQDPERLVSILAHEVAHAALDYWSISSSSRQEHEDLTDALTAISGFGFIMARAYAGRRKVTVNGVTVQEGVRKLGYLDPHTCARLADIQSVIASGRVHDARRVYRDAADHIMCVVCSSKLRLPDITARIVLTCPCCASRQLVRLERRGEGSGRWFARLINRLRNGMRRR